VIEIGNKKVDMAEIHAFADLQQTKGKQFKNFIT